MSDTVVSLLTAPGTGAIATIEVRGPRAWELAKALFKPAGKPLPDAPDVGRFWFGTLGADELVLACVAADGVEVHCHGGRRVVRWVIDQFLALGAEERTPRPSDEAFELLQRAPTLRTANILLDQLNGAFAAEVRRILALLASRHVDAWPPLGVLASRGVTAGSYLVEPWKVVVAGPPNAGKSSLVNALAGYHRAVVSEVAGTTRDVVSVQTAFEGWPVELTDTAGLRGAEGLEAEGVARARHEMRAADALVWLCDGTDPGTHIPDVFDRLPREVLVVFVTNKCDRPPAFDPAAVPFPSEGRAVATLPVSARTGAGLDELIRAVIRPLPDLPPGAAVPFTPQLARLISAACARMPYAVPDSVAEALREALALAESYHTPGAPAGPSNP